MINGEDIVDVRWNLKIVSKNIKNLIDIVFVLLLILKKNYIIY